MNDEVRAGRGGSGLRGIGMMQQGEVELREVSGGWLAGLRMHEVYHSSSGSHAALVGGDVAMLIGPPGV